MSGNPIRVDGCKLLVGDQCIELPHEICEVLRFQNLIVVRVDPPAGVVFNRNVIALTESGASAWQIEESPHGTEADKPYVAIRVETDGTLLASNWNGVDYVVDADSGRVTAKAFKK
jgi:hypothetical protein